MGFIHPSAINRKQYASIRRSINILARRRTDDYDDEEDDDWDSYFDDDEDDEYYNQRPRRGSIKNRNRRGDVHE